jgi:hypothetical protein
VRIGSRRIGWTVRAMTVGVRVMDRLNERCPAKLPTI